MRLKGLANIFCSLFSKPIISQFTKSARQQQQLLSKLSYNTDHKKYTRLTKCSPVFIQNSEAFKYDVGFYCQNNKNSQLELVNEMNCQNKNLVRNYDIYGFDMLYKKFAEKVTRVLSAGNLFFDNLRSNSVGSEVDKEKIYKPSVEKESCTEENQSFSLCSEVSCASSDISVLNESTSSPNVIEDSLNTQGEMSIVDQISLYIELQRNIWPNLRKSDEDNVLDLCSDSMKEQTKQLEHIKKIVLNLQENIVWFKEHFLQLGDSLNRDIIGGTKSERNILSQEVYEDNIDSDWVIVEN